MEFFFNEMEDCRKNRSGRWSTNQEFVFGYDNSEMHIIPL